MLRLRSLREEMGKTQSQMAEIFQISRQAYANYENEINQPSLQILIAMADYFQCSVDYLLGRSDDLGNITCQPHSFESTLPYDEKIMLKEFRKLSSADKKIMMEYSCFLKERHKK